MKICEPLLEASKKGEDAGTVCTPVGGYRKGLDAFHRGVQQGQQNCELVEVPYEDTSLPAYFVRADGVNGPAPVMVAYNGLDSMREMIYGSGIAQELARRGISTLIVDHPGSGEALRLRGLTGYHDSERWSAPVVNYLEDRDDVAHDRIEVMAWSLGGYYAPRAAASRSGSSCASPGGPTTTGASFKSADSPKRETARFRTIGTTCNGSSERTPSRTSWSSPHQ